MTTNFKKLASFVFARRKLFSFLVFCFLVIVPGAFAAGPNFGFDKFEDAVKSCPNQECYGSGMFSTTTNIGICAVAGCDAEGLQTGAIEATTTLIAGMYDNPPASGVAYAMDTMRRFNPVQPAYAQQGTGFSALNSLLPAWKAFRDFAYVVFTLVFVGIGLAIMFRMKLDPRTVITIQSAIPRVVIALLLVTFSYAIAGFMVDLLYVLIALVALIFGSIPGFTPTADLQAEFINGNLGSLTGRLFSTVFGLGDAGKGVGLSALFLGGVVALATLPVLGPAAIGVGALGGALVLLIFLLIVLYLTFKLFMELLKAYLGIVIGVVLGPLQIAMGVVPGMPGFGEWIKNLFANVLVFPAVAFVLLLGQLLIRLSGSPVSGGGLWMPPLLAGGSLLSSMVPLLIGMGMLMIVHQVPQVIKTMFGIKPLGFAPGAAAGFGFAPLTIAGGMAIKTGGDLGKNLGLAYGKRQLNTTFPNNPLNVQPIPQAQQVGARARIHPAPPPPPPTP